MHDHLPLVHPTNQCDVDRYLDLLRSSVRSCKGEIYNDEQLDEKIRPYVQEGEPSQRSRLDFNICVHQCHNLPPTHDAAFAALFKQKGLDVEAQFKSIAFEMFGMLHTNPPIEEVDDHLSIYYESENVDDDSISPSILKHGFVDQLVNCSEYEQRDKRCVWTGIREAEKSGVHAESGSAELASSGTFFYINILVDQENGGLKGDDFEYSRPFTIQGETL
ncbi:hypothetical protein BDN67DRAFT_1008998 [Paxillus ammoniavirescens]|nr:hypothetical protein BDN67DRAFT_1008998 [Paxillus ammoniavirescens]